MLKFYASSFLWLATREYFLQFLNTDTLSDEGCFSYYVILIFSKTNKQVKKTSWTCSSFNCSKIALHVANFSFSQK